MSSLSQEQRTKVNNFLRSMNQRIANFIEELVLESDGEDTSALKDPRQKLAKQNDELDSLLSSLQEDFQNAKPQPPAPRTKTQGNYRDPQDFGRDNRQSTYQPPRKNDQSKNNRPSQYNNSNQTPRSGQNKDYSSQYQANDNGGESVVSNSTEFNPRKQVENRRTSTPTVNYNYPSNNQGQFNSDSNFKAEDNKNISAQKTNYQLDQNRQADFNQPPKAIPSQMISGNPPAEMVLPPFNSIPPAAPINSFNPSAEQNFLPPQPQLNNLPTAPIASSLPIPPAPAISLPVAPQEQFLPPVIPVPTVAPIADNLPKPAAPAPVTSVTPSATNASTNIKFANSLLDRLNQRN